MKDNASEMTLLNLPACATWKIRHAVLWPSKPLDYVKLPKDEEGLHFGIKLNGSLVSVISLFITGEEAQFRKFATLTTDQGKGYGTQLLNHLMEEAVNRGVKRLWCNARVETASFYKRFGMQETETRFFKGDIPYVVMEKLF